VTLDESGLLRLSVTAHEAAANPEIWPQFLERYSQVVGARAAFLQRHHLAEERSEFLHSFGITRQLNASYVAHYSKVNVWRQHGQHLYVQGRVFFDEESYPRPLLKRSEFYNDCLLLNGITRSFSGVAGRRGDQVLTLTAMRAEHEHSFDGGSRKILQALLPHVVRAQITAERLELLEAGEAALNRLTMGVVLLALDRRVVFANREAEATLRAADGLALRHDRIDATSAEAGAALQSLFQYALAPGQSLDCPPAVLVPRPSGRRPYGITAAPLKTRPAAFATAPAAAAVAVITDPERQQPVAVETLRRTFRLTRREAALAAALAEGRVLAEAAERLGMRYETARTHLRRILSKTETSRQAQLVLLVERLVRSASLRRPSDD